jgi:nucleotide-binding universal stress UspA family protein
MRYERVGIRNQIGEQIMYANIVVAVDGSKPSVRALNEAIHMASVSKAKLCAVYVRDTSASFVYGYCGDRAAMQTASYKDARLVVSNARRIFSKGGVTGDVSVTGLESLSDDVASCLQRWVQQHGADLVVIGTHGRKGVRRLMRGSVAERFVRIATCPVLVVRDQDGNG